MKKLALFFVMTLVLLWASTLRAQDTDVVIGVNASFVPGLGVTAIFPETGPSLDLTGDFTYNETTNQVVSWSLSYAVLATGATGTLSGNTPFTAGDAFLDNDVPGHVGVGWLGFGFSQGSNYADLNTVYFLGPSVSTGQKIDLCPPSATDTPSGVVDGEPCYATSIADFNGQTGELYSTSNGNSSGSLDILSVAETPELPSWMLLVTGAVLLGLFEALRRRAAY
jgi:hypothetical protein